LVLQQEQVVSRLKHVSLNEQHERALTRLNADCFLPNRPVVLYRAQDGMVRERRGQIRQVQVQPDRLASSEQKRLLGRLR